MERVVRFFPFLVGVGVAGWIGAQFEPGVWYEALAKPPATPPNAVFGPVWTLLYLAIAVAGWIVFEAKGFGREVALWLAQLVLNALWSFLFFGIHAVALALIEIAVLCALIAATTRVFFKVSRVAGWLFVPYLAWVSFATYLNAGIAVLN